MPLPSVIPVHGASTGMLYLERKPLGSEIMNVVFIVCCVKGPSSPLQSFQVHIIPSSLFIACLCILIRHKKAFGLPNRAMGYSVSGTRTVELLIVVILL